MLNITTIPQTSDQLHPQGQTRIKTAATLIGVHHQTLRRWWKADKFPKPIDINGLLLFRNSDLLVWLASHTPSNDDDQASITLIEGA